MYVELSTKTNLRKQLQYLEESITQKKGLSECVSQDISDDEEILSPVPSDPEEGPRDNSLPILEGQRLNEILDNNKQDNGEPADNKDHSEHLRKGNADLVHRNSAVRETPADTKDLGEIQEILGDHNIDGYVPNTSQKGIALGFTSVTTTSVMEDQDSTEHAATEADNAQLNEPSFDQAHQITEYSTQAEGSSTSSTLEGDIITAEEDLLEDPEAAEDREHIAINGVSDAVDLQHDVDSSRETLNNDFSEQSVGYAQMTSNGSGEVQNDDVIASQRVDVSQAEFMDPSMSVHEANEGTEEYGNHADETEADLGGSAQYAEVDQGGEDDQITDNYHDDLIEEEQYGTVYQEPAGGPGDDAEEVSQDHTTAAINDPFLGEEEDEETNLPEIITTGDVIEQSLAAVNDKDDLTPQTPMATASPEPESQSPNSISRKRSRGLDNDEYYHDALEGKPGSNVLYST